MGPPGKDGKDGTGGGGDTDCGDDVVMRHLYVSQVQMPCVDDTHPLPVNGANISLGVATNNAQLNLKDDGSKRQAVLTASSTDASLALINGTNSRQVQITFDSMKTFNLPGDAVITFREINVCFNGDPKKAVVLMSAPYDAATSTP